MNTHQVITGQEYLSVLIEFYSSEMLILAEQVLYLRQKAGKRPRFFHLPVRKARNSSLRLRATRTSDPSSIRM